jgi:hypothetical protein
MNIADWLKQNGTSAKELAEKSGIDYFRLCGIKRGDLLPEPNEIWVIQELTGLGVTLADFVSDAQRNSKLRKIRKK